MEHRPIETAKAERLRASLDHIPDPSIDVSRPRAQLDKRAHPEQTPLVDATALAAELGIGSVCVKDERARLGLGSFKALGAAYVVACDAESGPIGDKTYVTASAGNHGISVAVGAQNHGAKAVIYIAETVPEAFAERLRSFGAEVRREGAVYEDSMAAAAAAADANGWVLLSDSSWEGYVDLPRGVMEGYLVLMSEVGEQMDPPPTHIFLQAGVGGLAAASAAYARVLWGDYPRIIIVEPEVAPAIYACMEAGAFETTKGPSSEMGRLDCKEASLVALKGLARDANDVMTISEVEGAAGAAVAEKYGLASTPSGAAGLSGLLAASGAFGLDSQSRVLLILSERPEE